MPAPQGQIPTDLQVILDELARTEREAEMLVAGLTDSQLNWQPNGGASWSIAQCLDHLARINKTYTAALREAIREKGSGAPAGSRPIRPGWFSRLFLRSMDAPPRLRFAAPAQGRPAPNITRERAIESFVSSHDDIRSLLRESSAVDLNRIRFKNPFVHLLSFTVGTGLLIILAHDRRHLWQAEQVGQRLERGAGVGH